MVLSVRVLRFRGFMVLRCRLFRVSGLPEGFGFRNGRGAEGGGGGTDPGQQSMPRYDWFDHEGLSYAICASALMWFP